MKWPQDAKAPLLMAQGDGVGVIANVVRLPIWLHA